MIKIEINNQQSLLDINDDYRHLFEDIACKAADMEGYDNGEISLAFVDNEKIRELNKKYRNLDKATDVLSFPMDNEIWGDIVISVEMALIQAEEYGHSVKRELSFLFVHGILHLLGYEHQSEGKKKEMRQKEERILGSLNISRD